MSLPMKLSYFKSSHGFAVPVRGEVASFLLFFSVMGRRGKRNGHNSTELVAGLEGNLGTLAPPTVPYAPSLILL